MEAMTQKPRAQLSNNKKIPIFEVAGLVQEPSMLWEQDFIYPLSNENQSLFLVFDGFISNHDALRTFLEKKGHCFNSRFDSGEVVLHLFEEKKEETFELLNGMFACAIWNDRTREMILARDRYGIKMLYYYDDGKSLVFSSRIKPILNAKRVKKKLNQQAFFDYLSLNYIPFNQTIFQGIEKVSISSYVKFLNQSKIVKRYWDFQVEPDLSVNEKQVEEELGYKLKAAVSDLLPRQGSAGIFLSGGLDSGAIAYYLKELRKDQIDTFGISFKEKAYDEAKYAKEIAERLDLKHHVVQLDGRFMKEYDKVIICYENLQAETSMIPFYYLAENVSRYKNCMFCGESGDELLGGYPELLADRLLPYYKRVPSLFRSLLLKSLVDLLPVSDAPVGLGYKAKHFIRGAELTPPEAHFYWRTVFTEEEKSKLLKRDFYNSMKYSGTFEKYSQCIKNYPCSDLLKSYQFGYLNTLIPDNNLPYYDFISSSFSIEMRYPFLDNRMVDFMLRIPMSLKLKNWTTKYTLRQLLENKLPKAVVLRKKHGLSSPIKIWIRKEMKDAFMNILSETSLKQHPYFNQAYVQQLLKEHLERKVDNSRKIWCLFCFVVWHNSYFGKG